MLVEKYIDLSIPVLKSSDTVRTAIKKFNETNLDQLPLVDDDKFQGILFRNTIESVIDTKGKLEGILLEGKTLTVTHNTHILEALRVANLAKLQLVCVVDGITQEYVGAIKTDSLLDFFIQSYGVRVNGSVLVISVLERDYSLSEICRIIESNDAKVLTVFTDVREDDPYHMQVSLKLNLTDISRAIAGLQRHNFNIIYSFHKEDFLNQDKERLQHLLRFLEI
ncbi:MAG: CBS domain-containing protein [Opitutaceae bacterium]|nr:CBS domain-containing protein [Cytophagales bacterium]